MLLMLARHEPCGTGIIVGACHDWLGRELVREHGYHLLSAAVLFALGSVLVSFGSRQAQRKGYIDVTTAF